MSIPQTTASTPTAPDTHVPPGHTAVTCSRCKKETTVPFTPTPGRPVFCRPCFEKPRPSGGRRGAPTPANVQPRRRMLSLRRKGHFVYDAMAALDGLTDLDEEPRRTFVEMVFARGSRQGTHEALAFIDDKATDGTLPEPAAARLADLVHDYSLRR